MQHDGKKREMTHACRQ